MIYVGIDIAKLNHYDAVLSSDGIVRTEPFEFSNAGDGFQRLSSELSDYALEPIIIGLESTAHYGDNLVRYLVANDYKVCVVAYFLIITKLVIIVLSEPFCCTYML